jgi:transposase-like protein
MKRKLFTPEQVIAVLREAETGKLTVSELCRKYGTPHLRWVQVSMK